MSKAQKIQKNIFGKETNGINGTAKPGPAMKGLLNKVSNLLIDVGNSAAATGTEDEHPISAYSTKLKAELGGDYQGVERYRLEQDDSRERHWKRWGPYLSERQWVGSPM